MLPSPTTQSTHTTPLTQHNATANLIYKTGQPALLYIVPSLIFASLATGAATGNFEAMWAFNAEEESDSVEA